MNDYLTHRQNNRKRLPSGLESTATPGRADQVNQVLYSIASAVNTTLDLDDLYQVIHHSLGTILDVRNFFIAIVNNHEKTLYVPYYVDTVDDDFSPITNFDTSGSLTGLVVVSKKPLLLYADELQARAQHGGIWGPTPLIWMGVPLIVREEVIGVIAVQSYTDAHLFTRQDLDLLTAISDQTAIAIDRKRSLENLKESEQRFRQLFEQSNDAIIIYNLHGAIIDCNLKAATMLRYSRDQLLKMNITDLHSIATASESKKALDTTIADGHVLFESFFRKEDGSLLAIEVSTSLVDKEKGIIQGIVRDISTSKETARKLLESEEKYRSLFHNAQVGLFRIDWKGRTLLECNDALAKMLEYSDRFELMAQDTLRQIFHEPKQVSRIFKQLRKKIRIEKNAIKIYRKKGAIGWFQFSATLYPEHNWIEGVVVDITDAKKANEEKVSLQKKLEQSKKMEALGLLAGGVAHDLNNILAGIISYPELLLLKYPEEHALKKPLETILQAGKRGALIVSDMLTIARSAANVKELCDLHDLITVYLESPECRQSLSHYPDISIKTNLHAKYPVISCSPVHINKSLTNLFTNAFEAIEGAGCITCSTKNTKEHLVLTLQDTGPGIPEKDRDHIFEPFYTKKRMGRSGTGLGLTVVWNTMSEHGGKVTVQHNSTGTSFSLLFPTTDLNAVEKKDRRQKIIQGNGETILVVDDEKNIRDISHKILSALGYNPHVTSSGEEAIEYLHNHHVDLLLLDMLMEPGLDGFQTYIEINKLHPGQKAIIASGYSKSENVKAALQSGVGHFIKKPYTIETLSQVISSELKK